MFCNSDSESHTHTHKQCLNRERIIMELVKDAITPPTKPNYPFVAKIVTFYCKTKLAPAYANMSSHGF